MTLSHRDRLLLAFADLAGYGIEARDALRAAPDEGHVILAAELAARHPHGSRPYAFWCAADDKRFDAAGRLTRKLPLHVSGDEVALAVHTVARSRGLVVRAPSAPGCALEVRADPGTRGRQAAGGGPVARDARGAS